MKRTSTNQEKCTQVLNRKLSYALLVFLTIISIGCDSTSGSKDSTIDSTKIEEKASPAAAMAINSNLSVLSMTRAQFENLVPLPDVPRDPPIANFRKWVLKHCLTDQDPNDFTLSVWPERSQTYRVAPQYLSHVMPSETHLGDTAVFFGDQKLNQQQVKEIRLALRDDATIGVIVFVPTKKLVTYHGVEYSAIVYDIHLDRTLNDFKTKFEKQPFTIAPFTFSNPSPPAAALDNANP